LVINKKERQNMYKCPKCDSRVFTRKEALTYHLKYCEKYKIFLDKGYECYVDKNGKKVYIHREILENKLNRKLKKGEVSHHKDNNKRNNNPENLELKTEQTHAKHHYEQLSDIEKLEQSLHLKKQFGENNGQSKLKEVDVLAIRDSLNDGIRGKDLAEKYNVDATLISQIKHRKIWTNI
jgi:hypothetical protein